jgi:16S rRNA (cytidine1402-2'-O)-methyltransferase
MLTAFGGERPMVFARELTKTYETIRQDSIAQILKWVESDTQQLKGEMVLIVAGADKGPAGSLGHADEVLSLLLAELPVKQAAHLASQITGVKKNELYQKALAMKSSKS